MLRIRFLNGFLLAFGVLSLWLMAAPAKSKTCKDAALQLHSSTRAQVKSNCNGGDGHRLFEQDVIKVKSRGQFRVVGERDGERLDLTCRKVGKKSLSMVVLSAEDGFLRAQKSYIRCAGIEGDKLACKKGKRKVLLCNISRIKVGKSKEELVAEAQKAAELEAQKATELEAQKAAELEAQKAAELEAKKAVGKKESTKQPAAEVQGVAPMDGFSSRGADLSAWKIAGKKQRLLLLRLDAVGVDNSYSEQAKTLIASSVLGIEGLELVDSEATKAALAMAAQKVSLGCELDVSCLADLNAELEAELVMTGSIGKIGAQQVLSLSLMRIAGSKVLNRVSGNVSFAANDFAEQVSDVVGDLFGLAVKDAPRYSLPEGQEVSFAVFPLKVAGVSEEVARNLTQLLSVELKSIDGTSVVSKEDIQAMMDLEAAKSSLGCADDSCLAEIGGALGVDKIVIGQVGKVDNSFVISLRLMDAGAAKVDSRITETFIGDEGQLISAIKFAGRQVVGVLAKELGTLAVTTSQEGTEVFLDGELLGTLPSRPFKDLKPGRHSLRLHKKGFFDVNTDVYVEPATVSVAWAELEKQPGEWYEQWELWAISGGVSVGLVTVGAVSVIGLMALDNTCGSLGCYVVNTKP